MEYSNIYDKFGEKTGELIERNKAHKNGTYHRAIHLWLMNMQNEILIQQRSSDDEWAADFWYVSVAGHVDSSEGVKNTLIRETKEELGLDISHITDSIQYLYTFTEHITSDDCSYNDNEIIDVFVLKFDFDVNQITIQAEEVQAVKFITYDEFKKVINNKDKSFWHHIVGFKMLLPALDDFCGSI